MPEPTTISPALGALLDIMTSHEVPEAKCIEAARAIIEYEAPAEVFDLTHRYLMGVATEEGQDVTLKLKALELIRRVEAKKVVPGTAKAVDTAKALRLGKQLALAKRRMELVKSGNWPPSAGWGDDLGDVRGVAVEEEGFAERLEAARERRNLPHLKLRYSTPSTS